MKFILLLVFVVVTEEGCPQQDGLTILKATSQNYSGGAAGSGYGTYYKIYLQKVNPAITFDSIWVNEKRIKVEIMKKESLGDTTLIYARDHTNRLQFIDESEKQPELKPISFPVKTDANALLGYFYNEKRSYLPIATWQILPAIHYP